MSFLDLLKEEYFAILRLLPRLMTATLLVAVAFLAGSLARRLIRRARQGQVVTDGLAKLVFYLCVGVGVVSGCDVLGLGKVAVSIIAAGGAATLVFAFAFQQIGENLLAGLFLSVKRSFEIGDLVQIGEITGEVKALRLRQIHLRTEEGCDIFVPTIEVFKNALMNYTRDGLRRPSFCIGIDYGDDAEKACQLLTSVAASTVGVLQEPPPTAYLSEFASQYVEIRVRFWINTFEPSIDLYQVRSAAMINCQQALRDEGFTFSSDTTASVGLRPVTVQMDTPSPPHTP